MTEGGARLRGVTGVSIASTHAPAIDSAVRELRAAIAPGELAALLVFFSPRLEPSGFAQALAKTFDACPVYGCSSAGELSLEGMSEASAVAIALPADEFTVVGGAIHDLQSFSIEDGRALVRDLRARLDAIPAREGEATFALTLIDGLCRREERVVSALYPALDDIPLVGGSAGDDLRFERTHVLVDGRAQEQAAIVLLVRTTRPFRVFKVDHFEPMQEKMVVTAAHADERTIIELNAEPAAEEYARAIGAAAGAPLDSFAFAAHPVVVRVGGEYYARSIQRVNEDGSLSFFCAIDEGLVLTAAQPRHMIESLAETFDALKQDLGQPDFVLGFDCVLRRIDAAQGQITRELSAFYKAQRVVGFNTYGEQYRSMHLNQTFTGVAFGPEPEDGA